MTHEIDPGQPERRSFLGFAIFGIGAIFSALLGVPIVCYVLDPRHRKAPKSDMKLVDGVKLDELEVRKPVQGVVRDQRMDGWTLYPNDVIGRVWVVKRRLEGPAADLASITAFNSDQPAKDAYLIVFTTICPHLGCSVNLNNAGDQFACPCHAATFFVRGGPIGARVAEDNPAQRGMDTLDWEIDVDDPTFNRIKVKYKKFKANEEHKIPLGGEVEEAKA